MVLRSISLTFLLILILTGCSEANKTITLDQVVSSIEKEDMELVSKGESHMDQLVSVSPHLFRFSGTDGDFDQESIYIYVYDSEDAVRKAVKEQNQNVNSLTFVQSFQHKNVFVIYATYKKSERHLENIEAALKKLE
ncbi:hypothetical protein [Paenibacillus lutrae]|uniref:DUF4358 domain-containing protein n=1 Tax=Paenibacillus lutrae TaxID=2078573 RepID=A0A7X3JZA3_9BACL|nr:hypothetical protein [Paenibacillus lutrae]MVO99750.1 hypothetical protein [Paenibacillus lutrae]